MGKKTILILSTTNTLVPRVKLEKDTLENNGYNTEVILRFPTSWGFKTFIGLYSYYVNVLKECFKENVWAVHITHISQLPLSVIIKLKGKMVVYDAYERFSIDITEKHFNKFFRRPVRWIIELLENQIIRFFVDAIFVVSTPDEFLYRRYRSYCDYVECLYNVPSKSSVFQGSFDEKFNEKIIKIVYIGGIWIQKGSDKFIPLAKLLRDRGIGFELHLIGAFDQKITREILLLDIEKSDLSNFVIVHEYMEYLLMLRFLNKCHIGLNLTSNNKRLANIGIGSSRKNYTYMSAGMAVITTRVGQMAYVTQKENCGIVLKDLDDLNSIAAIIEELSSNREKAITFAKNGIKAIRQQYNWEAEQNKVIKIYESICSICFRSSGY